MATPFHIRERLQRHATDIGGGVADTVAVICIAGMVGGAAGLALATAPIWAPVFFMARVEERSFQRKTWSDR